MNMSVRGHQCLPSIACVKTHREPRSIIDKEWMKRDNEMKDAVTRHRYLVIGRY